MNCEYCGRKLRPDEGKGCRFCAGEIRKQLEAALLARAADDHYQAHAESHGHLSGNPNDYKTL